MFGFRKKKCKCEDFLTAEEALQKSRAMKPIADNKRRRELMEENKVIEKYFMQEINRAIGNGEESVEVRHRIYKFEEEYPKIKYIFRVLKEKGFDAKLSRPDTRDEYCYGFHHGVLVKWGKE